MKVAVFADARRVERALINLAQFFEYLRLPRQHLLGQRLNFRRQRFQLPI